MEHGPENHQLTTVSIHEALDALQKTELGLAYEREAGQNPKDISSLDSVVYGPQNIIDLFSELAVKFRDVSNSHNLRDDTSQITREYPIASMATVEIAKKLSRESSIPFGVMSRLFFDDEHPIDSEKSTVHPRLKHIAGALDQDFLQTYGIDELRQIADILEGDHETVDFEDYELLFSVRDFSVHSTELLSRLQPSEIFSIFTRLLEKYQELGELESADKLYGVLAQHKLLPSKITSPQSRQDWLNDHRAGSRALRAIVKAWTSSKSGLDLKPVQIEEELHASESFVFICFEQDDRLVPLYSYADRPVARYALNNPNIRLKLIGRGDIFYEKPVVDLEESPRTKPGRRFTIEHGRKISSAVGVALHPSTPDSLAADIEHDTVKVKVLGNTLLSAFSALKTHPELLEDRSIGLRDLSFPERLFALAASPQLRQAIFDKADN